MKKIFCLLMAAVALAGCKKEEPGPGPGNTGALSLTSLTSSGAFVESTRSEEDAVDCGLFAVTILNTNNQVVKSWSKYADITGDIDLMPGQYTVQAGTPDPQPAAFEQPVFSGSQSFEISERQTTSVTLECKLANMKVTVAIAESFTNELEDYQITVLHTANANNHLVFHAGETRTSGYFSVAPLTVQIRANRTYDGSAVSQNYLITDVAAQDHHILSLSAEERGHLGLEITVDYTLNDKEHEIVIPIEPEPEEISITGAGIGSPLTLTDAQAGVTPVRIAFTVPEGIAELWVTLPASIQSLLESVMGEAVPSPFDLCDLPAGLDAILEGVGLLEPGQVIAGRIYFTFDLTAAMAMLPSDPDTPQQYDFIVKVVDSQGEELQETVTIIRETGEAPGNEDPTIARVEVGKTLTETLTLADAPDAQVSVMIAAPRGIKNLFVEIDSNELEGMLAAMSLPSSFDLANMDPTVAAAFGPGGLLALISEPVSGKTECLFDISRFMGPLSLVGVGTYPFNIQVVDENGAEASATLTIILTN